MKIIDHQLQGEKVTYQPTPNYYNPPFRTSSGLPDAIVIHYTAMTSVEGAVKVLTTKYEKGNASAHLVIGKQGEIVQLSNFNFRTWHAGKSQYNGRSGYNSYSIGIEIDNVGWLNKMEDGTFSRHKLGKSFTQDQIVQCPHFNPNVHYQYWERFTDSQIETVTEICQLLYELYGIKEILGHDEIAPDRKQDPGPAFDIRQLRNDVLKNRSDEGESGVVSASMLNIRAGAGTNFDKVAQPLIRNTEVEILEESGDWYKVKTSIEGWVSKDFIEIKK
ncbi:N-acetylmuramoyl-L-alanine amidase [Fulvivirga maritima]|uniref:N-acetylmuramoyl-L-alanine amidase n=1 Tax=Fulvivirga maritima TaxID=2904247 RepID=UPI001F1BF697|nr:N-acetylmuramoyl-L-alanine amidase [Fulvivirga maritima]UII25986.1 N-acetylmuramoyl-L-alanine amidase [Fulvivirga maritima]